MRSHCSLVVGDHRFDLSILKRPDLQSDEANLLDRYKWLHPDCIPPPMPFDEGPLSDLLLDPDGIFLQPDGANLKKKLPALSLANRIFLGPVPPELKDLTMIEESMIARCRSKCWVIQLKEENQDRVVASTQRGMKGHTMIYPQKPSKTASILPPSVEEITAPFVFYLLAHLLQPLNGSVNAQNLWL
ncbi:hypothetical protein DFH07DRAFT_777384 [Mycena maculata]|uniref:DUF6570 domain-containing protein n=1 Tax=Mycena maculata TaxID=230809 RepID=A0AAD7IHT8_9AGAR|nr:hypothetical protein DFH07DRAFT_777384 [Mycena maculata]